MVCSPSSKFAISQSRLTSALPTALLTPGFTNSEYLGRVGLGPGRIHMHMCASSVKKVGRSSFPLFQVHTAKVPSLLMHGFSQWNLNTEAINCISAFKKTHSHMAPGSVQ